MIIEGLIGALVVNAIVHNIKERIREKKEKNTTESPDRLSTCCETPNHSNRYSGTGDHPIDRYSGGTGDHPIDYSRPGKSDCSPGSGYCGHSNNTSTGAWDP